MSQASKVCASWALTGRCDGHAKSGVVASSAVVAAAAGAASGCAYAHPPTTSAAEIADIIQALSRASSRRGQSLVTTAVWQAFDAVCDRRKRQTASAPVAASDAPLAPQETVVNPPCEERTTLPPQQQQQPPQPCAAAAQVDDEDDGPFGFVRLASECGMGMGSAGPCSEVLVPWGDQPASVVVAQEASAAAAETALQAKPVEIVVDPRETEAQSRLALAEARLIALQEEANGLMHAQVLAAGSREGATWGALLKLVQDLSVLEDALPNIDDDATALAAAMAELRRQEAELERKKSVASQMAKDEALLKTVAAKLSAMEFLSTASEAAIGARGLGGALRAIMQGARFLPGAENHMSLADGSGGGRGGRRPRVVRGGRGGAGGGVGAHVAACREQTEGILVLNPALDAAALGAATAGGTALLWGVLGSLEAAVALATDGAVTSLGQLVAEGASHGESATPPRFRLCYLPMGSVTPSVWATEPEELRTLNRTVPSDTTTTAAAVAVVLVFEECIDPAHGPQVTLRRTRDEARNALCAVVGVWTNAAGASVLKPPAATIDVLPTKPQGATRRGAHGKGGADGSSRGGGRRGGRGGAGVVVSVEAVAASASPAAAPTAVVRGRGGQRQGGRGRQGKRGHC